MQKNFFYFFSYLFAYIINLYIQTMRKQMVKLSRMVIHTQKNMLMVKLNSSCVVSHRSVSVIKKFNKKNISQVVSIVLNIAVAYSLKLVKSSLITISLIIYRKIHHN